MIFLSFSIVTLLVANLAASQDIDATESFSDYFKIYDSALPLPVFNRLDEECIKVSDWIAQQSSFQDKKRQTFWLDLSSSSVASSRPRFYIELAVMMLKRFVDFNSTVQMSHIDPSQITGAEWWVQHVESDEDIPFHFDKDEAYASLHQQMSFPALATVTYIRDYGAPTVVFNQSTDKHGNDQDPVIPELAFLAYPRQNRHIHFKSDLQHGAVGKAAIRGGASKRRLTLLVNWWTKSPLAPNTIPVTEAMMEEMELGSLLDPQAYSPAAHVTEDEAMVAALDCVAEAFGNKMAEHESQERQSAVMTSQTCLAVPVNVFTCQSSTSSVIDVDNGESEEDDEDEDEDFDLVEKRKCYGAYVWTALHHLMSTEKPVAAPDAVAAVTASTSSLGWAVPLEVLPQPIALPKPELCIQHIVSFPPGDLFVFYLPRSLSGNGVYSIRWKPTQIFGAVGKLDLFYTPQVNQLFQLKLPKLLLLYDHNDIPTYHALMTAVMPLARDHLDDFKAYLCPYNTCSNALQHFGLTHADLPRAVIHDTVFNRISIQPKAEFKPSRDVLEQFWQAFNR